MSKYDVGMLSRVLNIALAAFFLLCGLAVIAVVALSIRDL